MIMEVQVLFFGATAEIVGERAIRMDFPADTQSGAAFDEIKRRYPRLTEHALLLAVNQEYATGGEAIKSGDELAVFTAVSGG